MKKIYLLSLVLISSMGYSQTITAVHPVLDFSGPDNASHSIDVDIKNTGTDSLTVLVKRLSESMAAGHQTYFCWFECYDPSIALSPVPITLAPGETTSNFHGWVTPAGVGGQDTVNYALYDQNGNSDTLYLTLTYDFIHDGINEISSVKNTLSIFVDENKNASIDYSCSTIANSKIQISNILGKVVKEIVLSDKAATVKVQVNDMLPGIYFCNLLSDNKFITSKKFLIQQ